jgi:hypothetical protein
VGRENPDPVSQPGDLWLLGKHRLLCGNSTSAEDVNRLLAGAQPSLMVTDPPYGIELDSEWRDRAGLNSHGPAQASYMKRRTEGHKNTTISEDTRADWSDAFALVPSLQVAYLARIEVHPRGARWVAPHRFRPSPTSHLGQGQNGPNSDALLVPT